MIRGIETEDKIDEYEFSDRNFKYEWWCNKFEWSTHIQSWTISFKKYQRKKIYQAEPPPIKKASGVSARSSKAVLTFLTH